MAVDALEILIVYQKPTAVSRLLNPVPGAFAEAGADSVRLDPAIKMAIRKIRQRINV